MALRLLQGYVVAVTADGHASRLAALLRDRGATVIDAPGVSPPARPSAARDVVSAIHAVVGDRVDAVTFTNAPAVRSWVEIARDEGLFPRLLAQFQRHVIAACLDPPAAHAARQAGLTEPLLASKPGHGPLVAALSQVLEGRGIQLQVTGMPVRVQGSVALIDGQTVEMSAREAALLRALAGAGGATLSRQALLRTAWPAGTTDGHTVDVTVARLRRRLGPAGRGLQTVRRRGYRLAVEAE